jgi:two-component system NtrC family sensor kinase
MPSRTHSGLFRPIIMNLSVLSMGLIPLTWAYAITRYRLMDVDIIFQQGYVYTLATLAVIGTFYASSLWFSVLEHPAAGVCRSYLIRNLCIPADPSLDPGTTRPLGVLSGPLRCPRNFDRICAKLSSETDANVMLAKVSDRLKRTLSIQRIGFFLKERFGLRSIDYIRSAQMSGRAKSKPPFLDLDLSFLVEAEGKPYIFFERPKHLRDIVSESWPQSVRDTIERTRFHLLRELQDRGRRRLRSSRVSRTTEGDFLSSDDLDLLVTLSNYVAIAIENSRLYTSLEQKADEYERLKEFSENIVESINVGVLAVDLEDRVESWNNQIEKLTGISGAQAIGRRCPIYLRLNSSRSWTSSGASREFITSTNSVCDLSLRPAKRSKNRPGTGMAGSSWPKVARRRCVNRL